MAFNKMLLGELLLDGRLALCLDWNGTIHFTSATGS